MFLLGPGAMHIEKAFTSWVLQEAWSPTLVEHRLPRQRLLGIGCIKAAREYRAACTRTTRQKHAARSTL